MGGMIVMAFVMFHKRKMWKGIRRVEYGLVSNFSDYDKKYPNRKRPIQGRCVVELKKFINTVTFNTEKRKGNIKNF